MSQVIGFVTSAGLSLISVARPAPISRAQAVDIDGATVRHRLTRFNRAHGSNSPATRRPESSRCREELALREALLESAARLKGRATRRDVRSRRCAVGRGLTATRSTWRPGPDAIERDKSFLRSQEGRFLWHIAGALRRLTCPRRSSMPQPGRTSPSSGLDALRHARTASMQQPKRWKRSGTRHEIRAPRRCSSGRVLLDVLEWSLKRRRYGCLRRLPARHRWRLAALTLVYTPGAFRLHLCSIAWIFMALTAGRARPPWRLYGPPAGRLRRALSPSRSCAAARWHSLDRCARSSASWTSSTWGSASTAGPTSRGRIAVAPALSCWRVLD